MRCQLVRLEKRSRTVLAAEPSNDGRGVGPVVVALAMPVQVELAIEAGSTIIALVRELALVI